MQIEQLYDKVAETYNQGISGQVLNKAKESAVSLAVNHRDVLESILALGMGDGTDLLPYKKRYPQAELHGLDISENMLKKAKEILDCKTYYGDIAQASSIITKHDFDLVIAHFVTAYVPLPVILNESKKLMAEQGMISVVTNTMASFPGVWALKLKFEKSTNPIYRMAAYHAKKTMSNVYVPKDTNHLQSLIEANGFKIIALSEENIQINLQTEKECYDFLINGGWFVSGLIHPLLPSGLIRKICTQLIHHNFTFPYEDSMKIAIALAERA